jgi:hypothetical protein
MFWLGSGLIFVGVVSLVVLVVAAMAGTGGSGNVATPIWQWVLLVIGLPCGFVGAAVLVVGFIRARRR